jgi:hypothetical protein
MSASPKTGTLACRDRRRRAAVREHELNGLDYLEVSNCQHILSVYFLGRAPKGIEPGNVRIEGGRRITGIQVTEVTTHSAEDPGLDDWIEVRVDRPGDFSTYTLRLVDTERGGHNRDHALPGFDPRYTSLDFSFKASCSSDLDCATVPPCPAPERQEPPIEYLARDYEGFRQLIFDRLALLAPEWRERHVPDLGVALVEVLAYVGDQLSYYQDAVATEAYLEPARERISVARHARLVDYRMHEGCNARAFLCLGTKTDFSLTRGDFYFTTGFDRGSPAAGEPLRATTLLGVPASSYEVFEAVQPLDEVTTIRRAHSRIRFYTWGDRDCCLPKGATTATLLDDEEPAPAPARDRTSPSRALHLKVGDFVVFEEVKGPKTGADADADPTHRHVVRLTSVKRDIDRLTKTHVLEITWSREDALPFPLCISSVTQAPECQPLDDVSIACGNVILVDHGRTIEPPEDLGPVPGAPVPPSCDPCEDRDASSGSGRYRPELSQGRLTFAEPAGAEDSAVKLLERDARKALPSIRLKNLPPAPDGTGPLLSADELRDPRLLVIPLKDPSSDRIRELRARLTPATVAMLDVEEADAPSDALIETLRGDLGRWVAGWTATLDLLASGRDDPEFAVELDNEGRAWLRFGDGELGRRPEAGSAFVATYRIGNGPGGNVGAGTITRLVFRNGTISGAGLTVCNPLPARGGTAPEPTADVKLLAPHAFHTRLERAITASDYATLAKRDVEVQGASARLAWTGSWYEAQVAVDQRGKDAAAPALLERTRARLERYRRIGHDLDVQPARLVPIDLALLVCVVPHSTRAEVKAALLEVLSNRRLRDGKLGFFHPDRLTFGEGIELSGIVAAAQAVPGVESVTVRKLERLYEGPNRERQTGVLPLQSMEVAQLDNDPDFPEHGRLTLVLRGGR